MAVITRLGDVVDLGYVAAHVLRAGDHRIRAAHHPPFGGVDGRLRAPAHPALVAPIFGGVHGDHPRKTGASGQRLGRLRHQPVVGVDEVEAQLGAQLAAQTAHVPVHGPDPLDERAGVRRERGLSHPVHGHAVTFLSLGQAAAAARQHVDLVALGHQRLRELAHMAAEPALDHRRIFPGQQQDAHGVAGP